MSRGLDPATWTEALADVDAVLFVGDSWALDMAPAQALGMRTCWVGTGDAHGVAAHQMSRLEEWPW